MQIKPLHEMFQLENVGQEYYPLGDLYQQADNRLLLMPLPQDIAEHQ